jgi:sec-independent protein translocase protein TatA
MLPNVGWSELIVILVVALLVFGPHRLAEVGGALGRAVREFRRAVDEDDHRDSGSARQTPQPPHPPGDPGAG